MTPQNRFWNERFFFNISKLKYWLIEGIGRTKAVWVSIVHLGSPEVGQVVLPVRGRGRGGREPLGEREGEGQGGEPGTPRSEGAVQFRQLCVIGRGRIYPRSRREPPGEWEGEGRGRSVGIGSGSSHVVLWPLVLGLISSMIPWSNTEIWNDNN